MVEYEYYLIETSDDSTEMHSNHTLDIDDSLTDPGSEYAWRYEPFSECSVTCGTGIAVATAVCEDLKHPGRNLPDNLCSRNLETTKPLPIVQKCLLRECQPRSVKLHYCNALLDVVWARRKGNREMTN